MSNPNPVPVRIPRIAPIPTYIPAWQPHLLSGPSGVGKTCFCAWWAQRLRNGEPIFGKPTNALPWIGMIVTDREQEDTLQWYEIAGWPEIPIYSAVDDAEFQYFKLRGPEAAFAKLKQIIGAMQIPPNGLLILDPVSAWAGGDMNRYDRVMPAMGALSQLCLQRKITILGLAHTGKQKADSQKTGYARAQDKILGSMALLGSSGTQMALEGPDQTGIEGQYRFTWNPHHAPPEEHYLTRDEHGSFVPIIADEDHGPTAEESEHEKVLALVELVPTDPATFAALVAVADGTLHVSRKTVYRYLQQGCTLGLVEKVGHGQYRRRLVQ